MVFDASLWLKPPPTIESQQRAAKYVMSMLRGAAWSLQVRSVWSCGGAVKFVYWGYRTIQRGCLMDLIFILKVVGFVAFCVGIGVLLNWMES